MMQLWCLRLVSIVGFVAITLVCIDFAIRLRNAWRRRQKAQGGVYGVVIDLSGKVIGTYVDPLQIPRRASYAHGPGSVWTGSDASDPSAWAWDGQGATEAEARHAALRLRQMYLRLLPELGARLGDGELRVPPWS